MQWLQHEEFVRQRQIEIGINSFTGNPARVTDYNMGDAFGVFGMTGYGKSILTGNLACELAQDRRLIIFDYKGDYKNLKYVNMQNHHKRFKAIPDLVYLHHFGFKLQDFTNPFDWEMLGMTANGAQICTSKAKMVLYHRNNFEKFKELIEDVETYSKYSKNAEAWQATKQSILSKLNKVKSCFVEKAVDVTDADFDMIRYKGVPFYVSNWNRFVARHKHICLNMNAELNPLKAQLFAGKILNEIEFAMKQLYPVIVIEEAHKLVPEGYNEENIPYSLIKILHYLKELHKYGVKLILISQYPHQIQDEALDEIKRFFFGKLQNVKGHNKLDEMFKLSLGLNYNYIDDYREFWHYSPLYNERGIFIPYDSLTVYEKRK